MRMGNWVRLLLCAAPLLAGCAGFWDAPSGGGGGGAGTTLSSGNFYILNRSTTSQVAGYNIASGTLTALSNSPYIVTGQAYAIAVGPSSNYLYISSTNGVYLYSIDSTSGALTQKSLVFTDLTAAALQVDPTGAWLIDASSLGTLNAIPITGTGTADSTRNVQSINMSGTTVQQMAISSNGYIAVALGSTGTELFDFSTNNATPLGATANLIKPYNTTGGAAVSVAVDPQNRLLYIGETAAYPGSTDNSGGVRAFTFGATLTEISKTPYASGGTGPHAILPKSTGDFVYVANWAGTSAGNITGFQVTTTNSALSLSQLFGSIATGNEPVGLVEDSKLNFILAVNSTGTTPLDAYIFDTTTAGKLDLALTGSTGTGPVAIAAP